MREALLALPQMVASIELATAQAFARVQVSLTEGLRRKGMSGLLTPALEEPAQLVPWVLEGYATRAMVEAMEEENQSHSRLDSFLAPYLTGNQVPRP